MNSVLPDCNKTTIQTIFAILNSKVNLVCNDLITNYGNLLKKSPVGTLPNVSVLLLQQKNTVAAKTRLIQPCDEKPSHELRIEPLLPWRDSCFNRSAC